MDKKRYTMLRDSAVELFSEQIDDAIASRILMGGAIDEPYSQVAVSIISVATDQILKTMRGSGISDETILGTILAMINDQTGETANGESNVH